MSKKPKRKAVSHIATVMHLVWWKTQQEMARQQKRAEQEKCAA